MSEWICLGVWGVVLPIGWFVYDSLSKRIDRTKADLAALDRETGEHSERIASQAKATDKLDREVFDRRRWLEPPPKGGHPNEE